MKNALGQFMNIYVDINNRVGLNKFAIKQPAKQFQCTFDLVTLLVFEKAKNIYYTVKILRNFCGSVERKSGESNSLTYFAMTYYVVETGNMLHKGQHFILPSNYLNVN